MSQTLFGLTSIFCFALPILTILYFRLFRHTSLIALMVYYGLAILRCLNSSSLPPVPDFNNTAEALFGYIEVPLMLLALHFFCPAKQHQQPVYRFVAAFAVYEVFVAALYGFTPLTSLYIMTPGLVVIVLYSFFLFLRQLRFTLLHGKNAGRVLMLGALLFSYSCYLFVFVACFILDWKDMFFAYALHFFSASMAAVMMSAGLYLMRHRIRELQELKVTRRELQMVFGS